jgi:hypothetical protein
VREGRVHADDQVSYGEGEVMDKAAGGGGGGGRGRPPRRLVEIAVTVGS